MPNLPGQQRVQDEPEIPVLLCRCYGSKAREMPLWDAGTLLGGQQPPLGAQPCPQSRAQQHVGVTLSVGGSRLLQTACALCHCRACVPLLEGHCGGISAANTPAASSRRRGSVLSFSLYGHFTAAFFSLSFFFLPGEEMNYSMKVSACLRSPVQKIRF